MFNIVLSKIHNRRDGNNFEMLNFLVLDGDVPRSPSYGVFILQLIRFERVCSNVYDFNIRKSILTAYLLKQCYRYHKIRNSGYHRHSELIVEYTIGFKLLLEPVCLVI